MHSLDDTIVAISTPVGAGGIGIVRLSGPEALAILRRLSRPERRAFESHRLYHGRIVDPNDGEPVDEVLASCMRAPRSFTRQDVAEINCHGGPAPLRRVLSLTMECGARLAEPGEFTLRAFLNGRLDLAQAEAVVEVIEAQTDAGLRMALGQLEGQLSDRVHQVREELLSALAYLEATIDFAEDEIPEQDIEPSLAECQRALEALLVDADKGIITRQGVLAAIVGRPNVGKSSLLNALLRFERAIVTPIPGTTRDTLEESINLEGIPLRLVDTAGITESEDPVERLGIERSRDALGRADLCLMVIDGSEPLTDGDREVAHLAGGRPAVLAINKADLPAVADPDALLPGAAQVRVSALTGQGLTELEAAIQRCILGDMVAMSAPMVGSVRHRDALQRARDHVSSARESLATGLPSDFVSIDVVSALHELGEITGETASEELLDAIFARFCIGK